MIKEGKFGLSEAVSITTLLMVSKIFYTSPVVTIRLVGTSAWYMTLISCVTATFLFLLVYLLMKRFPGKNLIQIFEEVLGKVLGKIFGVFFSWFILYYSAMNLREFMEILKAYVLPYTAPSLILWSFIAVCMILAYLGLEVIARVAYLSMYPIYIGLILLLFLASNYYNPDQLKPYFGYGLGTAVYHGIFRSSAYAEVMLLALASNSLNNVKELKRAGLISLGITGVTLSICLMLYIMAFGYPAGCENLSGLFQLSRIIYLSRFIQRVESIFLFIWTMCSIVTVCSSFYMSISSYCKTFSIPDQKPIVFTFGILLYTIAIIPKNVAEIIEVHMKIIREYSGIWIFGGPIIVLFLSVILGKKGRNIKYE